ncbi:MAG: N-formylglutamate amidohydrolase [Mesorhizobium sp.]|uniref:N-formylglutamate amidohydrolase n=2 Tax=Mesorhizobium TaxID=68287 RepID=UPI000F760E72|nr:MULTISPECIES: N-formylglutamate amidohydrolase [unclassified Mesorhizobium]RVD72272.1 N-formylglutamate amidohydrolase [Mesorhizobium sp. M4A.F.Ca.ET.029.04.2.1]AZO51094.1 N-formylglutamate amidohydrolase [Mesorhizobium sp. M4B.F.Ca.ET.058.02.1.1]RWC58132.1 MAG: N-formylglutamate amidohydrolase [Mesorhizobium sp.]RWD07771.1 MAG: N-formylglutamate amidohydrolase [Mesorhizobium sp.]RWD18094.1 MAG: N-formylglutamate amidohydrolase [Mesorhizobium sp.]
MAVLDHDAVLFPGSFTLKTAAEDFSVVPPFEIRSGAEQRVPFLFNSPHSGRYYPERFLAMAKLDSNAIRRSEDCYVDELFGGAVVLGAPMLAANFPRAYLDVNREPWELDPRMFAEPVPAFCNIRSARVAGGLGTVPKLVGEGLDIYSGRLPLAEAVARIETVYKPYHETLKRLLTRTHARFGYAVLIDCHSMPASIRVGDNGVRPDFIIGDRFGISATAALTETAIALLTGMGYTVAHNKPYAGGFITEHYGRPARHLHALQIEVNRGLYMNERTFQKSPGFDALADDLTRFSADLMAMPDHHFVDLPLAAE